jgi:hypothetical protein
MRECTAQNQGDEGGFGAASARCSPKPRNEPSAGRNDSLSIFTHSSDFKRRKEKESQTWEPSLWLSGPLPRVIPFFGEDAIKCEQLQLTTSAARILREEAHRFRRSLRECKERIHEGTAERAHAHPESFEETAHFTLHILACQAWQC